jgi:uncharacterized membrane protein YkoI
MSKHTSPIHLALFLMTASVGLAACDAEISATDELRAALDDAEFDLGEAIMKAEAAVPEGTILEAELEFEQAKLHYEFALLQGEQAVELELGAHTGEVMKNQAGEPEDPALAAEEAQSLGGHANLLKGIAIAEARSGGQAFEIEVEDGLIRITVLAGDTVRVIVVEPGTGVVLEDKPSDDWDQDEDEDEPADE